MRRVLPLTALALAAVMVGGSLYLTLGLGLKACPLCIYQRSFAMAVAGLLAMGLVLRAGDRAAPVSGSLALLALPASAAGLGVAGFHVYLERSGVLECPGGILGIGHAPDQSLAGFVFLTALLLASALRPSSGRRLAAAAGGLMLGLLLALGSVKSAPPLPPPNPTFGPDGARILAGCEPALRPTQGLRPAEAHSSGGGK